MTTKQALLPILWFSLVAPLAGQDTTEVDENETQQDERPHDTSVEKAGVRISELVNVVGSRSTLDRLPGSGYVLDGENFEAQLQGFDDVHRMVRQIPGVVVQEEEGYGLRPNIGMRASGSERSAKITLMEDGVLIAPAPYTAPSAYYFPVTGRMQAIEVRKGSSQIKFGPRTTGGAMNLVSRNVPAGFDVGANVAVGSDQALKGHVHLGDSYENVGWLFETYQLRTDGFKALDGGGNTGFHLEDYLGKVRLNTSPGTRVFQSLELKVGAGREDSNETYLGLTDPDFESAPTRRYAASQPDNITWDHQQYQLQHFLAIPNGIDVTTTFYRNNFSRNWYKLQSILGRGLADIFDDPLANADALDIARGATSAPDDLQVRANNRSYYSMGIQSFAGFRFDTGSLSNDIEVGFRYHEDEEDRFQHQDGFQMRNGSMQLTTPGAPGGQTNRVSSASAVALFVQDTIRLSRLELTPGIRYETIDLTRNDFSSTDPSRADGPTRDRENSVSAVVPGVGFTYDVSPAWNVLGGVHKGFSPPGPGASDFTEPEQSLSYELGLRARKNELGAEVLFFYNDFENLLGADTLSGGGTGEGDQFNGGAAEALGIEASVHYDFARGASSLRFPFLLSYTFTDATFGTSFDSDYDPWGSVSAGDELPYLARHQLYTRFAVSERRFSAGLDASYGSAMRTVAGHGPIPAGTGTDAYFVVNLFGELALTNDVTFFTNVQNVGNNFYIVARRPAGARPGLPRTVMAGIKLRVGR